MNHSQKRTSRKGVLVILWLLQLIAEGLAVGVIWQLNMLPAKYFVPLSVVFGALWLLSGLLMLPGKRFTFRSGFGVFFSFLVFLLSCAGTVVVADAQNTISELVGQTSSQVSLAVYVREDDAAQTIEDASEYTFAIVSGYETERTQKAVESLQNSLGRQIDVTEYAGAIELMEGFFSGEVDALILNTAYAAILEDLDGYEDFSGRIRLLHEITLSENNASFWQSWKESLESNLGGSENEETIAKTGDITKDCFVVYISGSDTRNKQLAVSRSDVNILMVVNPQTKQVLLVNTPRDYYVANPAGNGALDKLTHCGIYGIECSVEALANLYEVDIDYYGQINFTGFETLIDAIGGITVYSDVSFSAGSFYYNKGENTLNGEQALAFARERHNLAGGDNARGRNQMKVIQAVIGKLTSGSTILANYADIMNSLDGMFATNLSMSEISSLVKMQLDDMASWNVLTYAVTGEGGSAKTYSMQSEYLYVMYQDEALVSYGIELINRVIAGEILTEADMTVPTT